MQQNNINPNQEDVSIPVKITDSIFMGDEVIAHVQQLLRRILNGSLSIKSPMSSTAQAGTAPIIPQSKECVFSPLTGPKIIYSISSTPMSSMQLSAS